MTPPATHECTQKSSAKSVKPFGRLYAIYIYIYLYKYLVFYIRSYILYIVSYIIYLISYVIYLLSTYSIPTTYLQTYLQHTYKPTYNIPTNLPTTYLQAYLQRTNQLCCILYDQWLQCARLYSYKPKLTAAQKG